MTNADSGDNANKVKRILNCIPSPKTENDWQFEQALTAGVAAPVAPPPRIDLRAGWWTIGDQGSTGSCVGWATADSVLRWHFVKAGKITQQQRLSPRFIWMAAKETDEFMQRPTTFIEEEGTSLKSALDIARKFGAVRDAILPFGTGQLYAGGAKNFYAIAAQLKIASYFNLGRDLVKWRQWLATQGPILTRLDVDSTWDNALQTHGKLDVYNPAATRGGHAVALVGYEPTHFIVRNSWGTTAWGDRGFGYASNVYASAAFTEAYGVSLS
jgi:hypothetical protein